MKVRSLLLVPALVVGLLIVFHLSRSIVGLSRSGGRVAGLVVEITTLEKEQEELRREKAFRQTEEFVEQEARDKLRMVKEGEHILVLPGERNEEKANSKEQRANSEGTKTNWKKWVDFWFGL